MDRKPVWINGQKVYVLPWARIWDVLMALPANDFHAVWHSRAILVDGRGSRVSPDDCVYSNQKITVHRVDRDGGGAKGRAGGTDAKSA